MCCQTVLLSFSPESDGKPLASGVARAMRARSEDVSPSSEAADAVADAAARAELGRGAWHFLHRVAAAFDKAPTPVRVKEMETFFSLVGDFYPCPECAAHFRQLLAERPVEAQNNRVLSLWLCDIHNDVNGRLKKPLFPCTLDALKERWGKCGCFDIPGNETAGA